MYASLGEVCLKYLVLGYHGMFTIKKRRGSGFRKSQVEKLTGWKATRQIISFTYKLPFPWSCDSLFKNTPEL